MSFCRKCGTQADEDGQADCYCHYPHDECESCGELSPCLEELVQFNFKSINCCSICHEHYREEHESWFIEVQLCFEGFVEDITRAFKWRQKHELIKRGKNVDFEPLH